MSEIDYQQAVLISEQWANDATLTAMRYALEANDFTVEGDKYNKTFPLTPKQWERLCTFFIVPNDEMDPKLNFNFQDKLSAVPLNRVIKFIVKTVQKKVLNILIMDHEMPFAQREYLLNEALDNWPNKALWQPKSSLFSKNYTCTLNEDHLRSTIKNFVGHHLSVNYPLFPYPIRSTFKLNPTKPNPSTQGSSWAGPM